MDEQLVTAFAAGMKDVMAMTQDVVTRVADPNAAADIIKVRLGGWVRQR